MINVSINNIRRVLLTLCLMAAASWAWADGVDSESMLNEALESKKTVITLNSSIALTQPLNISYDVTLDLNGHDLTADGFRAIHITAGSVVIKSDAPANIVVGGAIASNSSVIRVGDNTGASRNVFLTLDENVTVSTTACYGITVFGEPTTETLIVKGKVTTAGQPAVAGNGNDKTTATTITIDEKAEITSTNNVAIYHPQAGTLTVNGSVMGAGGIEMKGGTLVVGPTATITATGAISHSPNNDDPSTCGYAIAVVENGEYAGVKVVTVSKDATIVGAVSMVKDSENTTTEDVTFDGDVKMLVKVTDNTDKMFGQYLSFAEAVSAAPAGSTITLLDDCSVAATITTAKNFTLDLDGHTLTSDGQRAFDIQSGDVTIKSTTTGGRIAVPTLADHDSSAIRVGSEATAGVSLTVAEGVTIAADESFGIIIAGKNTPQTLTVEGAVATKIRPAIAGENGAEQAATTITIASTAVVTTTDEVAIYQPQAGALTVNGNVTGAGGVEIKGGTLTVSSTAEITATAAPAHVANNNGTSSRGYSVAIVESAAVNAVGATAVSVDEAAKLNGPVAQLQDSPVASFSPAYTGSAVNERVAAIGEDKYFTLKDAVDIVPTSGTVTLLDDLSLSTTLVMEKDKTSTLDLNGHMLTGTNCAAIQVTHGHVTIDGVAPSTVTVSGTAPAAIQVGDDNGSNRAVSLTIGENVTVNSAVSTAVLLSGSKTRETLEAVGTVSATGHSAIVAADEIERIHVAAAAKVSASDAVAIYQTNSGELAVDGSVSGTGTTAGAIEMKGGNLTVNSGATVAAVGTTAHTASATAPSTNGYAIALVENASFSGVGKANISKDAIITGVVVCLVDSKNINAAETFFTGDVTMIAETPNTSGLGEKYAKLPEAIDAAIVGKEVKLLDDLAVAEAITLNKAVTLNMDDYSITGNQTSGATVIVSANATLRNGGIVSTKEGISITAGTVALQQMTVNTTGVSLAVSGASASAVTADKASTFTASAANTIALGAGTFSFGGKAYNTSAVADNNNAIAATDNAALTVENTAIVSSTSGNGINWNSTGILTVKGGKIMGAQAVNAEAGTVTLNGGTFTGTGNAFNIAAVSCTPEVNGGTFICGSDDAYLPIASSVQHFVKGDFFSKKIAQTLCADGYMVSANPKSNGMYYLVDEIIINDGTSWSVPDETYVIGTARYVRNSGMGASGTQFGTLCLPFSFSSTQTGMTFYAVENIEGDVLNLTKINAATIDAGTPVVFQFESVTTGFTIESQNATISNAAAREANNLVGTFATQKLTSGLSSFYFLNGDAFHQATSSLTVPAYRAYIKLTSPSNRRVLYIHTDEAVLTGIDSAEQTDDVEAVYDLQGRLQSGLKDGMNVVKMKDGRTIKVHVKN